MMGFFYGIFYDDVFYSDVFNDGIFYEGLFKMPFSCRFSAGVF